MTRTVVTEDPAFGLTPVRVIAQGRTLAVRLHAAWREDHFAAETLQALARRLQAFVRDRYAEPGDVASHMKSE